MKYEEIKTHFDEVIRNSDSYDTLKPCKDTSLLFPPFYEKIQELIKAYLEVHETEPYILETYRSNDLQELYYHRGASKIRKNGMHHYGIAVDLVAKVNGKIDYDTLDYAWLRNYATKELGLTVLTWELAHFQYIPVSEQQALRNAVNA
jgi:hypothetical protein